MEHQDWTTVVLKRRPTKRETLLSPNGQNGSVEVRDAERNERIRMAKMAEMDYAEAPKKVVSSESLQQLIRKRMDLKLNQENADQLCNFPRYTFKAIESRRILPSSAQQSAIQKHLNVQLRIITQ